MSKLYVNNINSKTGAAEAINIDSSGRITTPARPAFHVIRQTSMSASGDITYETALFDIGSNVNLSTGEFTAPITGIYVLNFSCIGPNATTATNIFSTINGVASNSKFSARPNAPNNNENFSPLGSITLPVQLNANDVFKLNTSAALYSDTNIWVRFSGYLLG